MSENKMRALADELKKHLDKKKELKYTLKGTEEKIQVLSDKMIELLDEQEIKQIKFEGLGTFFIKGSSFPSVEDEGEMLQWIKDNGHGDIIKTGVQAQTLRAFCNSLQSEGKPLPPGVIAGHLVRKMAVR